jgi:hypothetical protein
LVILKHHIVPRHAGGTDDPSNIEEVTTEQHADRHKVLFEAHGRWQDFLAWKGLTGLLTSVECSGAAMREGGKRGAEVTNAKFPKGTRKSWNSGCKIGRSGKNNGYAHSYMIECPDGKIVTTDCLATFCQELGLKYNSFHQAVVKRLRSFKGYRLNKKLGRNLGS